MARVCCSFLSAISWLLTSNLPQSARELLMEDCEIDSERAKFRIVAEQC